MNPQIKDAVLECLAPNAENDLTPWDELDIALRRAITDVKALYAACPKAHEYYGKALAERTMNPTTDTLIITVIVMLTVNTLTCLFVAGILYYLAF